MEIKERLLEIRSECERRQSCHGCVYIGDPCIVKDLAPCDWPNEFIDWLAGRLKDRKAKWIEVGGHGPAIYVCARCGKPARGAGKTKWCANCGTEMEG